MKLTYLLCSLFAFAQGTAGTADTHHTPTENASKLIDGVKVVYRFMESGQSVDISTPISEADINTFLIELSNRQELNESMLATARRTCYSLLLSHNTNLRLIFRGHCIREQELGLLLNIKSPDGSLKSQNAEILHSRILKEVSPSELSSYRASLTLEGSDLYETSLGDLVNIIRDPVSRGKITKIIVDESAFAQLRCEYGIDGKAECAGLTDLLAQTELFARLSYLYIIRESVRYLVIRPAGEFIGVGVATSNPTIGATSSLKVNIIPGGSKHELLMGDPEEGDYRSFDYALRALRSPYAVEFFRSNGIDINEFLSKNAIELMRDSHKASGGVNGGSAGVSVFTAICSAITGEPVDPRVGFSGFMRSDGSVEMVSYTPGKARILCEQGYKIFGIPKLSMMREFGKGKFLDWRFPQLEPGNGLVRKVQGQDLEVHVIRGVADVLKLAFGFETKLNPNKQMMSWSYLIKHIRFSRGYLLDFLYERGLFEETIEEDKPIEIQFPCKRRKTS